MMNEDVLAVYWNDIPTGKENALTYTQLMARWEKSERLVRMILHDLSRYDNGDNYILIRSCKNKGFYKTDYIDEIERYRKECKRKAINNFAPLQKINRVLYSDEEMTQYNFFNNLRLEREKVGLSRKSVCEYMRKYHATFDVPLLSRMENGRCFPTPLQVSQLAHLYGCLPSDLISYTDYM